MQSAYSRGDVSSLDNKDTQRPTVQSFPERWRPARKGLRPLATSKAPTTTPVLMSNKFQGLLLEGPLLSEENPQFNDDPSDVHFAGGPEASTASGANHQELVRLNGKIISCQADMLLENGSTEFVRRYKIPTEPGKETFKVALADGTSSEYQH